MIENVSRFSHFSLFATPFTVKPGSSFSSHGQFEFDRRVTANRESDQIPENRPNPSYFPKATLGKRYCIITAPIKSKVLYWPSWTILLSLKKHWRIQGRGPGGPHPLFLRPNWGPMGRKIFFETAPPPFISGSAWPSPPIWRSGSKKKTKV